MKISEKWLRTWVDPDIDTAELTHQLTMAGHEVDDVEMQGDGLDGVVVGHVLDVAKHPDADRLSVCSVSTGEGDPVTVVCGAPNVVPGMKSPFAGPGTRLPNGLKLRKSKIRGVISNGMLCSAVELGLGDESDGIIALADDASTGEALADHLGLPDASIDLDLTPNRGDCFSIKGIARDVAALTGAPLLSPVQPHAKAAIKDEHPVVLEDPAACPRFAGRVVRNIDGNARSPTWMTERLRRVGLRPIHPVVDVTNYVMMELGQPLHAYDLAKLQGPIRPRFAKAGERVVLLDEKEVRVREDTVVITDDSGVIGLAGMMGGLSTMVTDETTDVLFEAAFWPRAVMAGRARSYGMHTDASLRFERGVDPQLQAHAVDRAAELLVEIAGGRAGPLSDHQHTDHLPIPNRIELRRARLAKILGAQIPDAVVEGILQRLGLAVSASAAGWVVETPSFRFDLEIEEDLIEEVARIYGYDQIPETTAVVATPLGTVTETRIDLDVVANTLVSRDYQEVVTYSFVDAKTDRLLTGVTSELVLANPISSEMSVMRGSLWSGMLTTARTNVSRQQDRVRLFEIGKSFHGNEKSPAEIVRVAGLALGGAFAESWSSNTQVVDFFDIKSDVYALLTLCGDVSKIEFAATEHCALQPGQAANVLRDGVVIAVVGKLHPAIAVELEIKKDVFLFELNADKTFTTSVPKVKEVSKYPAIRRDIAVVVRDDIAAADLMESVATAAPGLIKSVTIFDVYRGAGIEAGLKSVALGLILQETSRTLTDDDADSAMDAAVRELQDKYAAVLRD